MYHKGLQSKFTMAFLPVHVVTKILTFLKWDERDLIKSYTNGTFVFSKGKTIKKIMYEFPFSDFSRFYFLEKFDNPNNVQEGKSTCGYNKCYKEAKKFYINSKNKWHKTILTIGHVPNTGGRYSPAIVINCKINKGFNKIIYQSKCIRFHIEGTEYVEITFKSHDFYRIALYVNNRIQYDLPNLFQTELIIYGSNGYETYETQISPNGS